MFRTVPLSIIKSFSLFTQQWYMSYSLRAGSGRNSVLILLAMSQCTSQWLLRRADHSSRGVLLDACLIVCNLEAWTLRRPAPQSGICDTGEEWEQMYGGVAGCFEQSNGLSYSMKAEEFSGQLIMPRATKIELSKSQSGPFVVGIPVWTVSLSTVLSSLLNLCVSPDINECLLWL